MLIGKIGKDGCGGDVSLSHNLIRLINVQQIIIHVILIKDVVPFRLNEACKM